jgi:protoporphyrinogen oxidase
MDYQHKISRGENRMTKGSIVIIGAGISGISIAYFLKKPSIVLEKNQQAGGLCRSFYKGGFTFDCSGHFIHIKDKNILDLVSKLTSNIIEVKRNTSIYFNKQLIPFPFQANLYYLEEKIKQECVKGIIDRENIQIDNKMPFINWSKAMFGTGITKHFMEPYNYKLWSYSLEKLTAQWTGPFVPKPEAESIIKTAYKKNTVKYGYNSSFFYPKKGGVQALIDGFLKKIKSPIFNSETVQIDLKNKTVKTKDGNIFNFTSIISTQSLKSLIRQIKNVPQSIKTAADKLIHNSVLCINIGIKSKKGLPMLLKGIHWLYIPDKTLPFYRVGIYSNVSSTLAPKNTYSFYIEYSSLNGKYKGKDSVIKDLKRIGFINQDDEILEIDEVNMPEAYVIFDKNREKSLEIIKDYLLKNNIYSIGRYGAWEYSFIEKNIQDAKELAQKINKDNRF